MQLYVIVPDEYGHYETLQMVKGCEVPHDAVYVGRSLRKAVAKERELNGVRYDKVLGRVVPVKITQNNP